MLGMTGLKSHLPGRTLVAGICFLHQSQLSDSLRLSVSYFSEIISLLKFL